MKIPYDSCLTANDAYHQLIMDAWRKVAIKIGLRYNVFVEVDWEWEPMPAGVMVCFQKMAEIFFRVNGHKFEDEMQLRRAIKMKAFL
jgi:hypothetical protein